MFPIEQILAVLRPLEERSLAALPRDKHHTYEHEKTSTKGRAAKLLNAAVCLKKVSGGVAIRA